MLSPTTTTCWSESNSASLHQTQDASLWFVAYGERKAVAASLKPIYQAPTADAALAALDAFTASPLGQANPRSVQVFEDAWERFTPFLAFPPERRRVIYTTNAIESLNFQLRKIIKNRGHFPNDQAAVKLLWRGPRGQR